VQFRFAGGRRWRGGLRTFDAEPRGGDDLHGDVLDRRLVGRFQPRQAPGRQDGERMHGYSGSRAAPHQGPFPIGMAALENSGDRVRRRHCRRGSGFSVTIPTLPMPPRCSVSRTSMTLP
jgi:hypothetical protein